MRANPWCPTRATEWVRAEDEPVPCSWHHQSDEGLLTIYPPEYRSWAEMGTLTFLKRDTHNFAPPVAIASPPAGAIYSIDPTLRSEFQALPLRAVTSSPTTLTWLVDGRLLGTTSSERPLTWPLAVGTHRIEVRDVEGRSVETKIVVK